MSFCIGKNADFIAVRNAEGGILRVANIEVANPLINSGFAVPHSVLESGSRGDLQYSGNWLVVRVYNGPNVEPDIRYLPLYNYEV